MARVSGTRRTFLRRLKVDDTDQYEEMTEAEYDAYLEQEAKKAQREDPEQAGKMDLEELKKMLALYGA